MRIAIIAPEQIPVPPPLGGSVEITVLAIAEQLAARHDVTIVSRAHRRYPKRETLSSGVRIERVPSGSRKLYLANVKRLLAGRRYDVIQIDNRPKFVRPIKRMFPKTTVSLFLHSLTFVSRPYASRSAARDGMRAAGLVVANSRSLKRTLAKRFPEAAGKLRRVWLGVDTARFTPSAGDSRPDRAFTLLFAGRLIPRKGLPVLLKAIRLARAASGRRLRLVVAGGGQRGGYAAKMRRLARKLGVRARFLGTVPHRRIHRVFRDADAFVCPSQKHEAFGLVNVEALASGLPVIASRIGGIGEIVKDGQNGYLIGDYRKPRAFADAILKLAGNPDRLRAMRRRARQDCLERFTWSATARRLGRLYGSPHLSAEEAEMLEAGDAAGAGADAGSDPVAGIATVSGIAAGVNPAAGTAAAMDADAVEKATDRDVNGGAGTGTEGNAVTVAHTGEGTSGSAVAGA